MSTCPKHFHNCRLCGSLEIWGKTYRWLGHSRFEGLERWSLSHLWGCRSSSGKRKTHFLWLWRRWREWREICRERCFSPSHLRLAKVLSATWARREKWSGSPTALWFSTLGERSSGPAYGATLESVWAPLWPTTDGGSVWSVICTQFLLYSWAILNFFFIRIFF